MPIKVMARFDRPLLGLSFVRLILTPLVAVGLMYLLIRGNPAISLIPLAVVFLIVSMPVAVSCSILTERFGQDTPLAARSIFITTLLSLVTVPVMFWLFNCIIPSGMMRLPLDCYVWFVARFRPAGVASNASRNIQRRAANPRGERKPGQVHTVPRPALGSVSASPSAIPRPIPMVAGKQHLGLEKA